MDNSCAKLPVFHIPSKQNWMPDSKELSDRRSNGGHSKWAVRDMDLGSNTGFIYTCAAVRFDADSWQPGVYHVFWPSWAESGPGPNYVSSAQKKVLIQLENVHNLQGHLLYYIG